jgi:thiol-disulfide isomerase/thioredoxin
VKPHVSHVRSRGLRALLVACSALLLCAAPAAALKEGDKAPIFTAPSLEGGSQVSLSHFRGKVVYLDFWASWCAPCLTSLPLLDELRKEFPAADFQIVAINVDADPKDGRAFLRKRPVGYPSATDPNGSLPSLFAVETMPTSFLIDRQGVIRHVQKGFRKGDLDGLREMIKELVASGR